MNDEKPELEMSDEEAAQAQALARLVDFALDATSWAEEELQAGMNRMLFMVEANIGDDLALVSGFAEASNTEEFDDGAEDRELDMLLRLARRRMQERGMGPADAVARFLDVKSVDIENIRRPTTTRAARTPGRPSHRQGAPKRRRHGR